MHNVVSYLRVALGFDVGEQRACALYLTQRVSDGSLLLWLRMIRAAPSAAVSTTCFLFTRVKISAVPEKKPLDDPMQHNNTKKTPEEEEKKTDSVTDEIFCSFSSTCDKAINQHYICTFCVVQHTKLSSETIAESGELAAIQRRNLVMGAISQDQPCQISPSDSTFLHLKLTVAGSLHNFQARWVSTPHCDWPHGGPPVREHCDWSIKLVLMRLATLRFSVLTVIKPIQLVVFMLMPLIKPPAKLNDIFYFTRTTISTRYGDTAFKCDGYAPKPD